MNNIFSKEGELEVHQQKEQSGLEDMDREANSNEVHFHSAREYPPYAVVKVLDQEGSWPGLVEIINKRGEELPKELSGSFTDVPTAVRTIQQFHLKCKRSNIQ